MADAPLLHPVSAVLYARREGGSAYGLRYVCDDVPDPFRAVVVHLDAKTVDPPAELVVAINSPLPRLAAPEMLMHDQTRLRRLEADNGALRDRLIEAQTTIGHLQRRLAGLLKHRGGDAPTPVALYREVVEAERAADDKGRRDTEKRYLKPRRR